MPRKLFAAISQIVLGALIVIAPQTFAHVCAVKDMPMACRYTARVALGLGVVIALLAIIGFFAPSRVRAGLDIANAVLGVLVVLVPTMLVGVCRGSMMHCHMVTMPTLIVLGVLLAVLAAVAVYHPCETTAGQSASQTIPHFGACHCGRHAHCGVLWRRAAFHEPEQWVEQHAGTYGRRSDGHAAEHEKPG